MIRLVLAWLVWPLRALVALLRALRPRRRPEWLELRLRGPLRWRDLGGRSGLLRRRRQGPTVDGIRRALEEAARVDGVRGVLVHLTEVHGSAAAIDGLAAALRAFRDSGREVVIACGSIVQGELPILAAASRVALVPGAQVMLLGISARVTSLRDALDRAGITPEFFRRGRFKNAPETFTHREVTDEHRQLVDAVLDHAEERLLRAIAARCGTDLPGARAILDGGPYSARRAVEVRLADVLAHADEEHVALGVPEKAAPRTAPLGAPLRRLRLPAPPRRRPRIAVVPVAGIIKPGPSLRWPGSEMAGADSVAADLRRAREDGRVKAVIVWIDSRGGAASASEVMWHAVRRCAAVKPTVAYVDRVAASGGYFAAAGARRIVAAPSALVGSVGAFAGRFDARRLVERLGIRQQVFLRGARAGLLEPAHELTDDERWALDRSVAETYEEFVERVALGRGVERARIEAVAEGRVFVAAQAPQVLVDEVAGFPAALAWVAREAGVDPEHAQLRRIASASTRPALRELFTLARAAGAFQPLLLWDGVVELG